MTECGNKVRHRSYNNAKFCIKKTGQRGQMKPYKCSKCGFWHIGASRSFAHDRFQQLIDKVMEKENGSSLTSIF